MFNSKKLKEMKNTIESLERKCVLLDLANTTLKDLNKRLENEKMQYPYKTIDNLIEEHKVRSDMYFRNSEYEKAHKELGHSNGLKQAKVIFERYIKEGW